MLRDRLQADLRDAMRAKDTVTTATIRVLLGALANAEAVEDQAPDRSSSSDPMGAVGLGAAEVARRELSDQDERAVLDHERGELRATALLLQSVGNEQSAGELEQRAAVIDRYLV